MDERNVLDIARQALRRRPEERAAFLDATCDSAVLRREVEALLAADAEVQGENFLDEAVLDLHALPSHAFDDEAIGRQIGPYVIEERLGTGGMGVVYAARDPRLERRVALKILTASARADAKMKARFIREARAASALDHPNICTVYDIGETEDGQLYTAMACYDGQTIAERLAEGPFPIEEAVDVLRQVAQGLTRAHTAGITHRDVKPSNLILVEDVIKVVDFGVAKLEGQSDLTATGRIVGTIAYMAPEQARGEPVDGRADVWALGVVAYEMLTGVHPFRKSTPAATLHALQHEAPAPIRTLRPDVPEALARVVMRMLARSPADRYATMREVVVDLSRLRSTGEARRASQRVTRWGMGGGAVLLLLVLALMRPFRGGSETPPLHAIAVLPMANHSVESELAPFAEAMTDALIADLGQMENLRVISRTSVEAYRAANKPLPEIAEELGVTTIVEGAVQARDGQVGVTVQLVDAVSDRILWAGSYERSVRNVVSLQHEVALAIAGEIEASISPEARMHLATTPEVEPEAYQNYLWGLYHRNHEAPDSWRQAARWLTRSIAIDSAFAPAHALLARVLVQTSEADRQVQARQAAERALALDPTLSDAHVSLGLYHEMVAWDWRAAERAFRRAIRHAPNDAEAHHELGLLLMRQRRFDEALSAVQQALYLDPLSGRFTNGVAAVYLFSGRYEEAVERLEQSLVLDEDNPITFWRLGQAYLELGRTDAAIDAFETMVERGGVQAMGHLGHALAVAGRRAEARAFLDDLHARMQQATAPDAHWLAYNTALVYVGLGEHDAALDWLERARAERSVLMVYLGIVPAFAPLYDVPRFQELLAEVGLDRVMTDA